MGVRAQARRLGALSLLESRVAMKESHGVTTLRRMKVLDSPVILPNDDHASPALRFFEAQAFEPWQGYLVGPLDWDGRGLLPCMPASTPYEAMENWVRQVDASRQKRRRA